MSHVIERAVTLSTDEWIDAEEFGLEEVPQLAPHAPAPEIERAQPIRDLPPDTPFNLDAVTRHILVMALEKTRGHKGQAADLLGVHPRTLTRMMRRFAIPED